MCTIGREQESNAVGEVIVMSLSVNQLEAILSESTDGFFDDSERPDDLRMTLRITLDIHKFFASWDLEPDASTISYAMGTIQSGIDEFVLIDAEPDPSAS